MDLNPITDQELLNEEVENSFSQQQDYSFELSERYKGIVESYSQKRYKKARAEIVKLACFSECNDYWKLIHLKIKCQEKIIEKKLDHHQDKRSNSSILEWLSSNESDIQYWFRVILAYTYDETDSENKIELVITSLLNQGLFYATYCVHQCLLDDCLSFLALSENLIRKLSAFIHSPDTIFVIQKIYLFSSSLYITNENYFSAKNYLILVLKLAFKEIELRIDNDFEVIISLDELNDENKEHLVQVLFNIATAMYQLGVCYENEGDIEKGHQAYKQSKWFVNSFLAKKYPGLTEFINDLERRIRLRIELCDFIKREEKNLGEIPLKQPKKAKKYYDELEKIKRFEKLQQYIESLKLCEVDDDEMDLLSEVNKKPMSQRVNVATRTIHVLNHLMSTKFQDVIKEMDNIHINRLEKDTKRAIEKRIISIKNTQRVKQVKDTIRQLFNIQNKGTPLMNKNHSNDNVYITTTLPTTSNDSTLNGVTQSTFFNQSHRVNMNPKIDQKTSIRLLDMKSRPITAFSKTSISNIKNSQINSQKPNQSHNQNKKKDNETNFQKFYFNHLSTPQSRQKKQKYGTNNTTSNSGYNSQLNNFRDQGQTQYNIRTRSSRVDKINYSKYVFNKSFRNKIDHLRNQFDKEMKFQKNLLYCKREEKREVDFDLNKKAIKRNCEIYFSNEYKKQKKIIKEKEEKESKNKIVESIHLFIKKRDSKGIKLTNMLSPYEDNSASRSNRRKEKFNTETINKFHLNKVEYDLENIEKKEEYLKRKNKNKQKKV